MLSTSPIKNVDDSAKYYTSKDNYYTQGEGVEQSEWYGKGSTILGLEGKVNPEIFTGLLQGKLPHGEQLGTVIDGNITHRPGWDLTFSAPKSFSIMALLGGDDRLIEAHRAAVKKTYDVIERNCSEVRIKKKGEVTYHATGNAVMSLYHHDVSRSLDPDLHTHGVTMNMTQRHDGQWRSQASKMGRYDKDAISEVHGFIERVRHHGRYYGKIYETELAFQAKELGYGIRINPTTGVFEIDGVPEVVIDHFSKRRTDIKQYLEERGLSGSRAAERAATFTRDKKKNVDRAELTEQWKKEAESLGFDAAKLIDKSFTTLEKDPVVINYDAMADQAVLALKEAGKTLSDFKTTFLLEDVIMTASSQAIREKIDVAHLIQAADNMVQSGEWISLSDAHRKTVFMTKETIQDEKRIMTHVSQSNVLKPKIHTALIHHFAYQQQLKPEMEEVLTTLFSDQRYVVVEGQRSIQELPSTMVRLATSQGLKVTIVSPTSLMGKTFAKHAKPSPQNLWEQLKDVVFDNTLRADNVMQFLSTKEDTKAPDVLLIDHSHLLSAKHTADLLEWGKDKATQMFFFSQKNVLLSQKTGVTTDFLVQNGIKAISLPESNETIAHAVSEQQFDVVAQKCLQDMHVLVHADERHQAMAKALARSSNHTDTFLMANHKKAVETLNHLTHAALKDASKLCKGSPYSLLIPQFLSEHSAKEASSYPSGHIVRFNEPYKTLGVERGDYATIIEHDKKTNKVILKKSDGTVVHWQPDKVAGVPGKVELCKVVERDICIGERLVFHRGIKHARIVKGESLTVASIVKDILTLQRKHGTTVTLDMTKPSHRHMDYGYAATPHAMAHERPAHIIADLPVKSFHTDQRHLFQMVSQAKQVSIYTDDAHGLITTLEKKTGDRLTAHDVLKRSDDMKREWHTFYQVLEKTIGKNTRLKGTQQARAAIDAVQYAMSHLSEREAGFTHKDVLFIAMERAMGNVSPDMLTDTVVAMEKAGMVFRGQRSDGTLWTTLDAVNTEREIALLTRQDQGTLQPIATKAIVEQYVNSTKLHPERRAAIETILQSSDRVLAIQGRAGTGKTTLMTTLDEVLSTKTILSGEGYRLEGIAPTHKAVKELMSRGVPARTIDRFLLDMQQHQEHKVPQDFSKTVLVMDEASMVSNDKMLKVLKIVHDFNFRQMIPTGDTPQFAAIDAGKPNALIQDILDPMVLKDIRRQKNPVLKKAVNRLYQQDKNSVAETFKILKKSIFEINEDHNEELKDNKLKAVASYENRVSALVNDYLSLLDKGEEVQIIAPSHEDRQAINKAVRVGLDQKGMLQGEAYAFPILSSKDMTNAERSDVRNYKKDHIIRFSMASGNKIKAGEYFRIKDSDPHRNILILQPMEGKGEEVVWQAPRSLKSKHTKVEIFEQRERDLKVNDTLIWTRSDKKTGILSTDMTKVTHLEKEKVTVQRSDGSSFTFDGKNPQYQHWDHGYAITAHSAQGGSYKTVLALCESYRKILMNLKTFLVIITRPTHHLRIYTDNKKVLESGITHHKADKLSSLEIIGEYPKSTRKLNHSPDNMKKDFMHDKVNYSISNLADVTSKDIHPKILDDVLKTTTTSDKIMTSIQDIANQTLQKDDALVSSYRAMLNKDTAKTISPTIEKEAQIEREI